MTAGNISALALVLALAWPGASWACDCPKAYMVKKYGTVAVAPPPVRPPPSAPAASPAGTPRQDGQSIVE